jgi:hypothetical protein
MVAIENKNITIVRSLLQHGLDVNVLTTRGMAFSLAAERYCPAIMQLLLQKGADLTNALLATSTYYPTLSVSTPESEVKKQATLDRLQKAKETSVVESHIQHLHAEFSIGHSRILELSRKRSNRWTSDSIANDRRRAWSAGFKVMRKLARGKVPETVDDAIMFLAIVKSICAVEDSQGGTRSDHGAQFTADLERWQMLFTADHQKLGDFREIVNAIWNVKLGDWQDVPPDTGTCLEFQKLVQLLVADAAPLFRTGNERDLNHIGLLYSQERWRLKTQQFVSCSKDVSQESSLRNEKLQPPWEKAEVTLPLKEANRDESSLRSAGRSLANGGLDSLVLTLMSGVIFGIFISFLIGINHSKYTLLHTMLIILGLHYLRSKSSCKLAYARDSDQSSSQVPVLRAALHHIFILLKSTNLLNIETLNGMRTNSENALDSGLIVGFSGLTDWLRNYVAVRSHNLRTYLLS